MDGWANECILCLCVCVTPTQCGTIPPLMCARRSPGQYTHTHSHTHTHTESEREREGRRPEMHTDGPVYALCGCSSPCAALTEGISGAIALQQALFDVVRRHTHTDGWMDGCANGGCVWCVCVCVGDAVPHGQHTRGPCPHARTHGRRHAQTQNNCLSLCVCVCSVCMPTCVSPSTRRTSPTRSSANYSGALPCLGALVCVVWMMYAYASSFPLRGRVCHRVCVSGSR